ncbi:hypothetical protein TNCV_4430481 [Trichonephila clavipes]|nr:hypothetical protein TNCV_4430481 [Trichonephila clavipes]
MISFFSWGQRGVRDGEAGPRRNTPHDRDIQGVSCEGQVPRPAAGFVVPLHTTLLIAKEFHFIAFVSAVPDYYQLTGSLPPLLDTVAGGGTPGRICFRAYGSNAAVPGQSMVAMNLGLQPSGFGFESRVRHGCIFFGKEVGLSPEMDSRLERKSSAPLLVICWDHRL